MASRTYSFTGGWQKFDIPDKVKSVTVELTGGGSGSNAAGKVTGKIAVTGKQTLWILVGSKANLHSDGNGGAMCWGSGGRGGAGTVGGNGGGGASAIRLGSSTGTIKAVAGGAGGNSGDSGTGGDGGDATGQNGFPGTAGAGQTGNSTGGTPAQPGNGGTSSAGAAYAGSDASAGQMARGGAGGTHTGSSHGGGGGGGGWYSGGGGQASLVGVTPGGGGAGGSNYVGGLTQSTSERGTGGVGHGQVVLSWVTPAPANQPPHAPTDVKVNGKPEADDLPTRSVGQVKVSAKVSDPDKGQKIRLRAVVSTNSKFTNSWIKYSDWWAPGKKKPNPNPEIIFPDVAPNTHYFLRLYSQDGAGLLSTTYNSVNFWSNRPPLPPELTGPGENAQLDPLDSTVFTWNHKDPDSADNNEDKQTAYELRWRTSAHPGQAPGEWITRTQTTSFEGRTVDPGTFRSNTFYDWTVRTRDGHVYGPWAVPRSFYMGGTTAAPVLLSPINGTAFVVDEPGTFQWRFRDPDPGSQQAKADFRYRVVGTTDWTTIIGDATTPGPSEQWTFPAGTLQAGYPYEWEVRTYDAPLGVPSDWSEPAVLWAVLTPGSEGSGPLPELVTVQPPLGCGHNRAFVYDQGGQVYRGEITPCDQIKWERKRDDVASCSLSVSSFKDCGDLLASIHCWMHEVVVFRDGVRVAEGPITLITEDPRTGAVDVEFKDVMAYPQRRILRQGFNDAYRVVNGEEQGIISVVERAARILMNALAYHDPNVLPYLTILSNEGDAKTSRSMADYSAMAWEAVDGLAATGGLDYTTVGRRIILNDTHRPIGRLPEMRASDFLETPIISEYGMSGCNYAATTNNNGVWGAVENHFPEPYGPLEMLFSAYGETAAGEQDVLTPEALEKLRVSLKSQAERNIAHRWPVPTVIRVPDNATLNPEINIGINQLVPGVWIPLRAEGKVREVSQWQKLDSVTVTETEKGETVQVVMSPAPNAGEDPDSGEVDE